MSSTSKKTPVTKIKQGVATAKAVWGVIQIAQAVQAKGKSSGEKSK